MAEPAADPVASAPPPVIESPEPLVRAQAELRRLLRENTALAARVAELEAAHTHGSAARRAALNLMEDAVESRRRAEALNAELTREVAERRRAEEALRDADRRKGDFLAMLGHELRNPLAAIKGGLALLQSKLARPESRDAALPIVAQQVAHMERLIDDVLDVARIERGKLQVRKEPIELRPVLETATAMVRNAIVEKGLVLQCRIGSDRILLEADAVRLTQVFVNLLSNAARFSVRGGAIEIVADQVGTTAVIRVIDQGAGISPETLPHVFDPFVQSPKSLSLPDSGLGLGLAVSRELVTLHGGTIEAFSAGEEQGSEFVVRLPVYPENV